MNQIAFLFLCLVLSQLLHIAHCIFYSCYVIRRCSSLIRVFLFFSFLSTSIINFICLLTTGNASIFHKKIHSFVILSKEGSHTFPTYHMPPKMSNFDMFTILIPRRPLQRWLMVFYYIILLTQFDYLCS